MFLFIPCILNITIIGIGIGMINKHRRCTNEFFHGSNRAIKTCKKPEDLHVCFLGLYFLPHCQNDGCFGFDGQRGGQGVEHFHFV